MNFPWWRITFTPVNGATFNSADCLRQLSERGVNAVEINANKEVIFYVEGATPSRIECEALVADLGLELLTVVPIEQQNWVAKCDELLTPVDCGRIRILPFSGDAVPQHNPARDLLLRPGMGFGTGHHSTTRTIVQFMSRLAEDSKFTQPKVILDIGTGSGVLALAAWKLWNVPVLGIDIDPDALANARENCEINGITSNQVNISDRPLESCAGPFDLILANLYLEILISYEHLIRGLLAPAGRLIVSGVMSRQSPELSAHYNKLGWHMITKEESDGWIACEYSLSSTTGAK